ncbi:hypothetical protein [Methanobrevibacter sp.]|uniref:hypothetical protein n=1 Tax=Methanobrevibacter sp. TaxID=66852 RepID=UPI00388F713D
MKTIFGNAEINNLGYYQIKSRKEGNHNKYLHRLNNCILNLQLLKHESHNKLHKKGANLSEVHKMTISESMKNKTGYFRVHKKKKKDCKQGFYWEYQYHENGKRVSISSVDITVLKEKVLSKNLVWHEFDNNIIGGTV